jgi:hypothetical protein
MYRGELVEVLDGRTANRERVGLLMATGGRQHPIAKEAAV